MMGKRYAVLVGINDYVSSNDLSYCVKDAKDVLDVLVDFCNVDKDDIRLITSEKISPRKGIYEAFIDIIDDFKKTFQKEDDIFFYFSGHGVKSSETTVIFKDNSITVSDIINKINELNPKTKIIIFDSCYAGAGYLEGIKSAQYFSQSSNLTTGHYILCACSESQTAKESKSISNGRFTHFLLGIIRDLQNYDEYGCLDVNTLFSKIDLFFKSNPDFEQNPYQQIKSVGSYPIANNFNQDLFYVRYDINNSFEFDWKPVVDSLNLYLDTKEDVIGNFLRFIREHCDNTRSIDKGKASLQSVEISKNKVNLIDNGVFFDLFNPRENIKTGGGIKTAKDFKTLFSDFFKYSSKIDKGLNHYTFEFTNLNINEICVLNVNWGSFIKLKDGLLNIPDICESFTIRFEKYVMIHSIIYISIEYLIRESKRTNKLVYLELHEGDILLDHVKEYLITMNASELISIRTYN